MTAFDPKQRLERYETQEFRMRLWCMDTLTPSRDVIVLEAR
jgi:hypothetical protein